MTTLVDMSMPIYSGIRANPDHFPPEVSAYATVDEHGWTASRLC
jgi:hypothetical protein